MPQKTRREKERAAAKRESAGKYTVPPAPISETVPDGESSYLTTPIPAPAARRTMIPAAVMPRTYDYSHVYSDLRRIGILALLCFGIMIALAFVLNR